MSRSSPVRLDRPTTVRLDAQVLEQLEGLAEQVNSTTTELVREGIRLVLARDHRMLRVCFVCGRQRCDHAAPPTLRELLTQGEPIVRDGVDLRAYTAAIWRLARAVP